MHAQTKSAEGETGATTSRWPFTLAVGVVLAMAAPRTAAGQQESDFQVWSALLGTGDLEPAAPGVALWLDTHARRGDTGTVHILRPGLGLHISPSLSAWAGYAWVPVFNDASGDAFHEHRTWQQGIVQKRLPIPIQLQSRTRFEQRFGEGSSDIGLRLRQFVRAGWSPWEKLPVGAVVWDEIFLGLNETDWGAPKGLDQNRLFLGLSLTMAPQARLEAGYLFLYMDRATDLFGHVLAVNLFVSMRPFANGDDAADARGR